MPILIDITPSNVQFLYNNEVYNIEEVMKSGKKLLITAVPKTAEDEVDKVIEQKLSDELTQ